MEIKTHEEQKDSFRDLVLILGAFHTSMSFYGSIGHHGWIRSSIYS